MGGSGLPQQDQSRHLTAGGQIETDGSIRVRLTELQQRCFVLLPSLLIRQQVRGSLHQDLTLLQHLVGESLIRRVIATTLKLAKNGLSIRGRTDAQQSEMIDGQVHHQRTQ